MTTRKQKQNLEAYAIEVLFNNRGTFLKDVIIRHQMQGMAIDAEDENNFDITISQTRGALARIEKILWRDYSENLAIQRGKRNYKEAWRIAQSEDAHLVEKNINIRDKQIDGANENFRKTQVAAIGNDIFTKELVEGWIKGSIRDALGK